MRAGRAFLALTVAVAVLAGVQGCLSDSVGRAVARGFAAWLVMAPGSIKNASGAPVDAWIHLGLVSRPGDAPVSLAIDGPWRLEPGETFAVCFPIYLDSVKAYRAAEENPDLRNFAIDWYAAPADSSGRWFRGPVLADGVPMGGLTEIRADGSGLIVVFPSNEGDAAAAVLPDGLFPARPGAPTYGAMRGWHADPESDLPVPAGPVIFD